MGFVNLSTLTHCYSVGSVAGSGIYLGGLAGYSVAGTLNTCFWDVQTSGQATSAGGTGQTTAQMKSASTFINGWDFATSDGDAADWFMPANDYPRLSWQPTTYDGGDGTASAPYQIRTPEQMNTIGIKPNDWNKQFILTADIDMSVYTGTQYNIIGNGTTPFTGTFDGNGHVIRNLTYTTASIVNYVGLFGFTNQAVIQNLALENAAISVGGESQWIGRLVGYNDSGTITTCYASGSVSGFGFVGGLVGWNEQGAITSCYSTGSVNGGCHIGGLVGVNRGPISNCYSWASISGWENYVGGLVGSNAGTVASCYAAGFISSSGSCVGGLVGDNTSGTLAAGFWDTQASGRANGVGNGSSEGAIGKTTAEMKAFATFTAAGWDFSAGDGDSADWWMPYREYPRLSWQPPYTGGSGTPADPYQIWTPQQMNAIGANSGDWYSHFILMADIDMSAYTGTQYNIIGNWDTPFRGSFNGNGHVIRNLTYKTNIDLSPIGFFGKTNGAQIQNLGLENISIVIPNGRDSGGLVGWNENSIIRNCYINGGTVSGYYIIGGLVGINVVSTIRNCYVSAAVSGTGGSNASFIGGLVGCNYGTITDCYTMGSVKGIKNVGGLVGESSGGIITCCYAIASVSGSGSNIAGLVGQNKATIRYSFWDTQTSGRSNGVGSGSSSGVTGKTTAQMKMVSTFTSAGWDFVDTWDIINLQTYPLLRAFSGINPADINYSGRVDLQDLAIIAANWMACTAPECD